MLSLEQHSFVNREINKETAEFTHEQNMNDLKIINQPTLNHMSLKQSTHQSKTLVIQISNKSILGSLCPQNL